MTTLIDTSTAAPQNIGRRRLRKAPRGFVATYSPYVKEDLKVAGNQARNRYRFVITPKRVLIRINHPSSMRIDLTDGCQKSIWLEQLYRNLAPAGTSLEFDYEPAVKAHCGDQLEDVWMLAVTVIYN